MSDLKVKISALTQGTPLDTDIIPYVDLATNTTKKALKSELKGDKGDNATVDVGTTTTGSPGTDASVVNVGTTSDAIFNFTIPRGNPGTDSTVPGPAGNGIQSVELISTVGLVKTYRFTFTDTTTFDYTTTDGSDGADGLDITWLGAYNAGTTYVINDAISYNGSSYICILESTGNLPTNTTYFDLMAQKGEDGNGSGDVMGPATNTDSYIPQWDGVNSKTLKNGIPTSTFAPALGADDNYVTDAEKIIIGNTSGTNSGNETTTTIGTLINGATEKTTPVDADMVGLMDSAATNILKKLSWANIKATLKTYFDSLTTTLTNKTINLTNNTLSGTKAEFDTAVSDGNICFDGDSVTNLNMNTGKLLGRNTASAGAVEEITVGTGLSFDGTTLNASGGGGGTTDFQYPHGKAGLVPFAKKITNATTYTPTSGKVGYITWAKSNGDAQALTPLLNINSISIGLFAYVGSSGVSLLNNPLLTDDDDVVASSDNSQINIMGFEVPADADITPITVSGSYTVPANKTYVLLNWFSTSVVLMSDAITVGGVNVDIVGFSNYVATDIDSTTLSPMILGEGDSINNALISHSGYLITTSSIT